MSQRPSTLLVVPCYDEAARLDFAQFSALVGHGVERLLFVDDGSTDDTRALLNQFARLHPERVDVVPLGENHGKSEAVRRGLLRALELGAAIVGYADADLSTPPEELLRLFSTARGGAFKVVLGSRVALLGSNIERSAVRHYFGRGFATVASLILNLPVYDTQCGAKVFVDEPALRAALATPFVSRWAFDVELLGRLHIGAPGVPGLAPDDFVEIPLRTWREVAGSKVGARDALSATLDLIRIRSALADRRRALR
jgi:glycosyltransferase involved in cell wall biosynthesis